MKIVFASSNENKVVEVNQKLGDAFEVIGLHDLGFDEEIVEDGETLEENARIKARCIWSRFAMNCFADDTGLLVDALDGAPGVYSARYAGPQRNAEDNMQKLMQALADSPNRRARFQTSICLILDGVEYMFEGQVSGQIVQERHGEGGFGYDPIFIPDGHTRTFAEMSLEEKNV
ncbi:MAG: RdgB/HAM1 family non-canonical purine NTP pyrophosphatase, partial [Flavobacteriales bacterium]